MKYWEHETNLLLQWKDTWFRATFGGEDGTGEKKQEPEESFVRSVLDEFGDRLIQLGRPAWRVQTEALAKTDYAGDRCKMFERVHEKKVSEQTTVLSDITNQVKGKTPEGL